MASTSVRACGRLVFLVHVFLYPPPPRLLIGPHPKRQIEGRDAFLNNSKLAIGISTLILLSQIPLLLHALLLASSLGVLLSPRNFCRAKFEVKLAFCRHDVCGEAFREVKGKVFIARGHISARQFFQSLFVLI